MNSAGLTAGGKADAAKRCGTSPCPLFSALRVRSTLGGKAGQFEVPQRFLLTYYANLWCVIIKL